MKRSVSRNAQILFFWGIASLVCGCAISQPETSGKLPHDVVAEHVPAAVIMPAADSPKDADLRVLQPEPGLSNASCGWNGSIGIEQEILRRVNEWRASARFCGATLYPAVKPLRWNLQLQTAAYHHSVEMARANLVSHVSIDSRELRNRVGQTGYAFSRVSENIAAGQSSITAVMDSWQKSPPHCAAMMEGKIEEIGVVCIHKPSSFYKFYWTMDMASPFVAPVEVKREPEKTEKAEKNKNHNPFLRIVDEVKKF